MPTVYQFRARCLLLAALLFNAFSLQAQWTTASLSQARFDLAATSAGGKVFFAGGDTEGGSFIRVSSDVVDIYDTPTNTWSTATLSLPRYGLAATSAGGKVFFAGGWNSTVGFTGVTNRVDIYDTATDTWSTDTLSEARYNLAATSAGGKVFFAGGANAFGAFNRVDIYDTATDTWSIATLSVARSHLAAASAGGKVFFEGGQTESAIVSVIDIYDTATNTWSTSSFYVARTDIAAASAGGKVYFGGGRGTIGPRIEVRIFDTSTNTPSGGMLYSYRDRMAATGLGTRVFFAGGGFSTSPQKEVTIFSAYDNHSTYTYLSQARSNLAATSAGGKAFFAGGLKFVNPSNVPSDRVDIYTATPTVTTQQPTPANQTACAGGTASSTVVATGNGLGYQWYRNNPNTSEPVAGQTSATLSLNNVASAQTGTYYCRVSGEGGEVWSSAFTLTVGSTPTGSNGTATVCSGSTLNVDLQARITNLIASNFTWTVANNPDVTGASSGSGDFITQTLSATSPQTVTYTVTPSNETGGCAGAPFSVTVTVNPTPTPGISAGGSTTFCAGSNVTLSTGSFSSYVWGKDGSPVSTSPTYTATSGGSYTVMVTNGNGCVGTSAQVVITVTAGLTPSISAGGPTTFCTGGSVVLSTDSFGSYSWKKDGSPVGTNPTFTATSSGSYTVTVTDGGSCSGTSVALVVTVNSLLFTQAATLPAGPFCAGQVVTLSFGANACLSTNSFTAQLSNASGDFSNPTATWTAAPGSNSIRLPLSADLGAGYVLRVVASPSVQSSTTGAFAITGRPTLGTPAVSGAPICAGQVVTLNLPVDCTLGFGLNNTFTPQLSDLNGNFSNPVNLAPVSPGSNAVRIPATTPGGTGYRLRVLSSDPVLTSAVSNAFEVKVYAFNSTATVNRVPVCAGSTFTVSFTLTVNCPDGGGPAFSGELSNAAGSFAAPVSLGSIQQGINSDVLIPQSTPAGSGYRVRVVVPGNPALTSTTSAAFQVRVPGFSSTPSVSGANKCPGEAVRLSFTAGGSDCVFFPGNVFTAQLSNASGSFAAPVSLGTVASGITNVVIPVGTPAGNSYKIRVVSSGPELVSSGSSNFSVKACGTNREITPEETGLQVSISPNPSPGGRLRISVNGAEGQTLRLELLNGAGVSLKNQRIERAGETEVLTWDMAHQPGGLYLLRVSGEREAKTIKVLH